jgi:hypothetical protein
MEKKLNEVADSYAEMLKKQKKARDAAQAGEEPEEAKPTKVKKAFNKKLRMDNT